jgi:hypothetical protein
MLQLCMDGWDHGRRARVHNFPNTQLVFTTDDAACDGTAAAINDTLAEFERTARQPRPPQLVHGHQLVMFKRDRKVRGNVSLA